MKTLTVKVKGREITVSRKEREDFISLTDIAFIGLWEQLHNPDFKAVEFDRFLYEAGSNAFVLSPGKWIDATNAVGITTKSGRYGGTFAHQEQLSEKIGQLKLEAVDGL